MYMKALLKNLLKLYYLFFPLRWLIHLGAPIDLDSSGTQLPPNLPTERPATKTVAAAAKDGPKSSKPLTGLDDHLAAYAPV